MLIEKILTYDYSKIADWMIKTGVVLLAAAIMLGSGEINHSGSGENRQFWSNENHQSGVASPQVVLFTRPAAGQPVSQQKYARQPSPASCPGSSPP